MIDRENYLISVIMPTYNRGDKLIKSINSIINQSIGFDNIELIIVDDASTDNTTKKNILNYQSQYPENIKPIFLKKNSKYPGKPRNIALNQATSNYIIFSDDDDTYKKDAFQILYNGITKYKSDMVMGRYVYTNRKFKQIEESESDFIDVNPLKNQKTFDILSTANGGGTCAKLYNKNFILNNNIKFLENGNMEDVYFYLNVLKKANKVTFFINQPIYIYNIYDESTIHSHNIKLAKNMIQNMYNVIDILKDIKLDSNHILSYLIGQILLVFTDSPKKDKEKIINDIYKLEKHLQKELKFNTKLPKKEISILNQAIMQKKFKKAIFISNIYQKLYNNKKIQKLYQKNRGST